MNALLQHRGHNLMGAGRSIAVQNFNEQACILGLGAFYTGMTRFGLSAFGAIALFGVARRRHDVALVVVVALRHVPETRDSDAAPGLDVPGTVLAALSLAALTWSLTALGEAGVAGVPLAVLALGVVALAAFVAVEHRSRHPLVPPQLFADRSVHRGERGHAAGLRRAGRGVPAAGDAAAGGGGVQPDRGRGGAAAGDGDHARVLGAGGCARAADRAAAADDGRAAGQRGRVAAAAGCGAGGELGRGRPARRRGLRGRAGADRRAADRDGARLGSGPVRRRGVRGEQRRGAGGRAAVGGSDPRAGRDRWCRLHRPGGVRRRLPDGAADLGGTAGRGRAGVVPAGPAAGPGRDGRAGCPWNAATTAERRAPQAHPAVR